MKRIIVCKKPIGLLFLALAVLAVLFNHGCVALSTPSSPRAAPLFRPVPLAQQSVNKAFVLRKVGNLSLDPPLVFPMGSILEGIELFPHALSASAPNWDAQCVVGSGLGWEQTYAFYRQYYAKAKVRWHGKLRRSPPAYSFAVYPNKGSRKGFIGYTIFAPSSLPDPDTDALGLSATERSRPQIWVGCSLLDNTFHLIQSGTGLPKQVIYVPYLPALNQR